MAPMPGKGKLLTPYSQVAEAGCDGPERHVNARLFQVLRVQGLEVLGHEEAVPAD